MNLSSEYTVFIDETFDGFMDMSKPDGFFCHGALMVPTEVLTTRFVLEKSQRATGKRLFPLDLRKQKAYVAGFFTTVESYLLYHLRTEIGMDDDATQLPPDFSQLLESLRLKMLEEQRREVGDSRFIKDLMFLTANITLHWLGSGKHPMRIFFDPRNSR